jgi:hypothetical protein
MISFKVAPTGRFKSTSTSAFLPPSRSVPPDAFGSRTFFAVLTVFAGFVASGTAVVSLSLLAVCGSSVAGIGAGVSVRRWTAFQMRPSAAFRSVNFFTGFKSSKGATPAKLFQISRSGEAGQSVESRVSSFSVENLSVLIECSSRAVRESYLARLAKIEFEARSGRLVCRDEVTGAAFTNSRTIRDNLLNIPDRIAAILAAESDHVQTHRILSDEIRSESNDPAQPL